MIDVGLIGFGLAGRSFHAPVISAVPGLHLAAILQRTGSEAAAAYPDARIVRSLLAGESRAPVADIVAALTLKDRSAVETLSAGLSAATREALLMLLDLYGGVDVRLLHALDVGAQVYSQPADVTTWRVSARYRI